MKSPIKIACPYKLSLSAYLMYISRALIGHRVCHHGHWSTPHPPGTIITSCRVWAIEATVHSTLSVTCGKSHSSEGGSPQLWLNHEKPMREQQWEALSNQGEGILGLVSLISSMSASITDLKSEHLGNFYTDISSQAQWQLFASSQSWRICLTN